MGTPVACICATLYYGSHKGKLLLKKYEKDILFLRRFIDDMFGIWICTSEQFESFKNDLPFGKLLWDATALGKSVNFLDLTITIEDGGTISTKSYQQAMNLHLYTPASSAHLSGMIKGVINSFIHWFYKQNSKRKDFIKVLTLLYQRLIIQGWDKTWMKQLIMEAVTRTHQESPKTATKNLQPKNSIFLHLQ